MNLTQLIKPKSVAVVGVSDKPGFGRGAAKAALMSKIAGRAYFVHPKRDALFGKTCCPSISALPEAVDCVVLCTPAATVPALLTEAGKRGVGAAVVYAGGFAEEGTPAGKRLEEEIARIAAAYDMAVLGPNCMGMLNNIDKVNLWGGRTHWDIEGTERGIAIIAQSGFVGAEILNTDFFHVSYAISTGNGAIVPLEAFLEFAVADDNVSVVALYLEGVRNADRFLAALKRAAEARKPVVILKAGSSAKGALSAASHTGSMAGSDAAYRAVFEKYGVLAPKTLEQFMCLAQAMNVLKGNLPARQAFASVSFSGGESTISADLAEACGLALADFSEATKEKIKAFIPAFAAAKNPLDATTSLFHETEKTIGLLRALEDEPSVGGIIVGVNVKKEEDATTARLCETIRAARLQGVSKPIFAVPSLEGYRCRALRRVLEDAGVPLMSSMQTAYACLREIGRFSLYEPSARTLTPCVPMQKTSHRTEALTEYDAKEALRLSGVPIPAQILAHSADEVKAAAQKLRFPLVMKINSAEILHKTEAGGVVLNIADERQALSAYAQILDNVSAKLPNAKTDGVAIQEMASPGIEMIVGVTCDDPLGPMVLAGLGGVFVELFKDAALYPAPLNRAEAHALIRKLKGYRLLTGYRGAPPADIDALLDLIVQISDYAAALKDELRELDLNPVLVRPRGRGVTAADALIVKYVEAKEEDV